MDTYVTPDQLFEAKFGGGPIESIKNVIDMIRGKQEFDPYVAIQAALEIAEAVISVFTPKGVVDGQTYTIGTTGDLIPPTDLPDSKAIRDQALVMALAGFLPPEEREKMDLCYTPKFIFPTDMIVKAVLVWVLQQLLQYGSEKMKEYLKRRRERKEQEEVEPPQAKPVPH